MESEIKQYKKELLKPVRPVKQRRSAVFFHNNDVFAADLLDVGRFAKLNKNVKFLLCVLDLYSRYAWVFPLKSKDAKAVQKEFEQIRAVPKKLWVDRGGEFTNNAFKEWGKKRGMHIFHTYGEGKSVFVERFNRTLRMKLNEHMIMKNTYKYLEVLPEIVKEYNDRVHSSIGISPTEVYLGGKEPLFVVAHQQPDVEPALKIGDFVRISLVRGVFEKPSSSIKWSKEVFKIVRVDNSRAPVLYHLEDQMDEKIEGSFYEEELQKTKLQDFSMVEKVIRRKTEKGKKEKDAYVKWDGYDDKFNSWVEESTIANLV